MLGQQFACVAVFPLHTIIGVLASNVEYLPVSHVLSFSLLL